MNDIRQLERTYHFIMNTFIQRGYAPHYTEIAHTYTMLEVLSELSKSDTKLLKLFETAREYADIYLLARKTQKGCDGMGELAMVEEEFRDSLYDLMNYCKGKGYIDGDIQYEIDSVADELTGLIMQK